MKKIVKKYPKFFEGVDPSELPLFDGDKSPAEEVADGLGK
jgi:hypothetical protein